MGIDCRSGSGQMVVVVGWYVGRYHTDCRVRWRCVWLGCGQVQLFRAWSDHSMCGTDAVNVW